MSINISNNMFTSNNQITFKGSMLKECKKIAQKQEAHLLRQSICWLGLEAYNPSTNVMDIVARKLCIDLGEILGNKITKEPTTVSNAGLNIFSYLKEFKNQAKMLF